MRKIASVARGCISFPREYASASIEQARVVICSQRWKRHKAEGRRMSEEGGDGRVLRQFMSGPIIHEVLSEDFVERVKAFKDILAEVETIPLENTLNSFRRDHHPEKELAIWEKIAKTYRAAMAEFGEMPLTQKKGILGLLLAVSMGDGDLDRHVSLTREMIVWVAEEYLGRHAIPGRAGTAGEYSENVPSDLEFLGGNFNVMPVEFLRENNESDSPGLRLLKESLSKALEAKSWDFSVQPFEEFTLVRGKHEGKWHELMRFPAKFHEEFTIEVARLFCGKWGIHWQLPLDGMAQIGFPDGGWYDLFVNGVPGIHGFILKFTVCSRERSFDLDLDKLGFDAAGLRALKQAVDSPAGWVLVTGPTHSGKSIVCCSSIMRRLRQGSRVTTIERPRKFRLPGARQILLESGVDYHPEFPNALADDPQVLMVQEVRSYEEIAASLEAAKTRLVVAGVHAWEVVPCLLRLHQWGGVDFDPKYDPELIRSYRELLSRNLSLVCSGRLVTRLCPSCRTAVEMPASLLARNGLQLEREGSLLTYKQGAGCEACGGRGVLGRTGIYEVLPISTEMRRLLAGMVPNCAIVRQAREEGLVSLRETALRLVLDGVISFQEAVSVTGEPYFKSFLR